MNRLTGLKLLIIFSLMSTAYSPAFSEEPQQTEGFRLDQVRAQAQIRELSYLFRVDRIRTALSVFTIFYNSTSAITSQNEVSPSSTLQNKMFLMSHLWNSKDWSRLSKPQKADVLELALLDPYSTPQYQWDVIFRLRQIGSLYSMSKLFHNSQKNLIQPDGFNRSSFFQDYFHKNHQGVKNRILNTIRQQEKRETFANDGDITEILNLWIQKKFKGDPNRLMESIDPRSSKEEVQMVYHLISQSEAAIQMLSPHNFSRLNMILKPQVLGEECQDSFN